VGVAGPPAGEEGLADVGLVVAVGVLERTGCRAAWWTTRPPLAKARLVGMLSLSAKDGELVGPAVAVGVLADLDLVVAFAAPLEAVRVVDRLGRSRAAHLWSQARAIGWAISGSAAKRRGSRPLGTAMCLIDSAVSMGRLHRLDRIAHRAQARPGRYWGMSEGAGSVGSGLRFEATLGRLSKTSPLLAAQRRPRSIRSWKPGFAPGPLVVAVGGVEDPALAFGSDPGPGLVGPLLVADLEDVAVLLIVLGVDVGLVPGRERL